jgi:hypothetical protein
MILALKMLEVVLDEKAVMESGLFHGVVLIGLGN